jgi:fatty acid desaturase
VSQLRDSVNVGGAATALLAPVGLRFHALHHLAPSLPYHSMGRVHRALSAELPAGSAYHEAASPGVPSAVRQLFRRAAGREPFALPDARPVLDD